MRQVIVRECTLFCPICNNRDTSGKVFTPAGNMNLDNWLGPAAPRAAEAEVDHGDQLSSKSKSKYKSNMAYLLYVLIFSFVRWLFGHWDSTPLIKTSASFLFAILVCHSFMGMTDFRFYQRNTKVRSIILLVVSTQFNICSYCFVPPIY